MAGDIAASRSDWILALASGLSAFLGIASAILIFVLDRLVRRYRVHDRAYNANLIVLSLVSAFSALLSALTWWAWTAVAPDVQLLFSWSVEVWMALLFGTITLAAAAGFLFGVISLIGTYLKGHGDDWDP